MARLQRNAGLCGMVLGALVAVAASADESPPIPYGVEWDERLYNPQPQTDDLILPMPCGGAMAFRKVPTPNTDGIVGDVPVLLGQVGSGQPFLDGLRKSYVSGAFPETDGAQRGYFYMAKYELTAAQYEVGRAATPEDCPRRVSRRDAVPKTDISLLELKKFAETLTLWLMVNAPEALPVVGQSAGFLRLPTEEEWEFSARGGLAVAEAEFLAPRPPIAQGEDYNEYIAHNGSDSSGGELQLIGTLRPNPLGLHDMLGNAWEFVGNSFSLVRHGRLHGQAGGVIRRGGGVNWPLSEITSAQRFEMAPYNTRRMAVQTERFTGARLVISAISITSDNQNSMLSAELDRIAEADRVIATSEDAVRVLLDDMRRMAASPSEQLRLQLVSETLAAAQAERNELRDKSLRMILNASVLLCNQAAQRYLTQRHTALTTMEDLRMFEEEALAANDLATLAEVRALIGEALSRLENLGEMLREDAVEYASLIEGLGADYSQELVARQADFIGPSHTGSNRRRAACFRLLQTHLATRFTAGVTEIPLILEDFRAVADASIIE